MPLILGVLLALLAGAFIALVPSVACPQCRNQRSNTFSAGGNPGELYVGVPCSYCNDRKRITLLQKWRYVPYIQSHGP